jgi:hypothetical protein
MNMAYILSTKKVASGGGVIILENLLLSKLNLYLMDMLFDAL